MSGTHTLRELACGLGGLGGLGGLPGTIQQTHMGADSSCHPTSQTNNLAHDLPCRAIPSDVPASGAVQACRTRRHPPPMWVALHLPCFTPTHAPFVIHAHPPTSFASSTGKPSLKRTS